MERLRYRLAHPDATCENRDLWRKSVDVLKAEDAHIYPYFAYAQEGPGRSSETLKQAAAF